MNKYNCIQVLMQQLHEIDINILKELQIYLSKNKNNNSNMNIGIFGNRTDDGSILFWCRNVFDFKNKANNYLKLIGLDFIYEIDYNPSYATKQSVYRLQLKETTNLNDIQQLINLYKLKGII